MILELAYEDLRDDKVCLTKKMPTKFTQYQVSLAMPESKSVLVKAAYEGYIAVFVMA